MNHTPHRTSIFTYSLLVLSAAVLIYTLFYTTMNVALVYAQDHEDKASNKIHTLSATHVTQSTAVLNAEVEKRKGNKHALRGFQYGTTIQYTDTVSEVGSYEAGNFGLPISGLSCGTTYHFRAFIAESSKKHAQRRYGADEVFTTVACVPDVIVGRFGVTPNGFVYAEIGNVEVRYSPLGNVGEGAITYVLEGLTYDPTTNTTHPVVPSDIQNITTWIDMTTIGKVHTIYLNKGAVVQVTSMGQE